MNENKNSEVKQKMTLKQLCNNFIDTCKEVGNYISKNSFKDILMLLGEILVIIILLCLLKIPFSLLRDFAIQLLLSFEIKGIFIMNLLYVVFGLPYYILVIYLFMKVFTKRYSNINKNKDL